MEGSVLVVDDERGQREIIKTILEAEGYDVAIASSGIEAMDALEKHAFDLVLTDLKMPGMDGHGLLRAILKQSPSSSVVIVTAHGTIDSAVNAIRAGAVDYLTKPLDKEQLLITVRKAVEKSRLIKENILLKEQLEERFRPDGIIGNDSKVREILRIIKKVSASSATVLIYGESGTGKELFAKAIHYSSPRSQKPFMAINCAAIPDNLLESELFGYEKGAFTGAFTKNIGLFETAGDGTIFLDEIGDMSLTIQAKLLRVLQEKEIRRLGGSSSIKVNARIISATNKDLKGEIKRGSFREDLYYRLNVLSFKLPPLRERRGDIPEFVRHFVDKYRISSGKDIKGVSDEAMNVLMSYNWPGNIRQLDSVIERAILLTDGDMIEAGCLPMEVLTSPVLLGQFDFEIPDEGISMEELERELIVKAMAKAGGVLTKAAGFLGMSYRTLQYRINKFGIAKEEFLHTPTPKGAPFAPKGILKGGIQER